MAKIHKLSPALADMIAAGEVVERPASVIKELVENAVDAGAGKVTVEIQNGGITYMRVTDDGCGMSAEDAPTAFLRHATSKISRPEDLEGISTMGFRGEALAAISAVTRIDLMTRTPDQEAGISMHVEAGNVLEVQSAGCPVGTTMIIRDLFFNTPARMKFLKRDSTEASYIGGAMLRQALGHPEIAFRYIRDGKQELSTPGDGKLLSAIYAAMGRSAAKEMVEVSYTSGRIRVSGYVGLPTASRGSRSSQHFFVNGRYVKSRLMSSALEEAYKNRIMVGRFPLCVLHLELPPEAVDVNVHPAKTEVKFLRENDIFDAIHYAVLGVVSRAADRPELQIPAQKAAPQTGDSFYRHMTAQEYREQTASAAQMPLISHAAVPARAEVRDSGHALPGRAAVPSAGGLTVHATEEKRRSLAQAAPPVLDDQPLPAPAEIRPPVSEEAPDAPVPVEPDHEPAPPAPAEQTSLPMPEVSELPHEAMVQPKPAAEDIPYRIIGQTMDTYIIVEQGDELLFFDKHAAHERINFERLRAQEHAVMSQLLLSPLQAELPEEECAALLEHAETLSELGFTIESFGSGMLLVRAIPNDIPREEAASCLQEIAQRFLDGANIDPTRVYDELLHTVACKASIKGGQKSDPMELASLVAELMRRDDIRHCPHGRPVCVTLSRKNLERQFRRS